MNHDASWEDVFGFVRPAMDAHTLGMQSAAQLLRDSNFKVLLAGPEVCKSLEKSGVKRNTGILKAWLESCSISRLGFSYRLDPDDAVTLFNQFYETLQEEKMFSEQGGRLTALFFAGLPEACEVIKRQFGSKVEVFYGDEDVSETLSKLGVAALKRPASLERDTAYDQARMQFGRELIASEEHQAIKPSERGGYPAFGTAQDTVMDRLQYCTQRKLLPLIRVHAGPYLPEREKAVQLFLDWSTQLAEGGLLDVLSIGTSQLTQSHFGDSWHELPNGGGVPLKFPEELTAVWQAARPMLVRIYAGTQGVPRLAHLYEKTLNMAWHALSLFWFCKLDGRGPYTLMENLHLHFETLSIIAQSGKPYEPNLAHHFSFRGSDDVSAIVAAVLGVRVAKRMGIRHVILQYMLNTPKGTWGIQDLAKARALLTLAREQEDDFFQVILQPRAGLDYFSHDEVKARAQLAAATALMDDIEPGNPNSPGIIHVVSYTEGSRLADPPVINESIRITHAALNKWRRLRQKGQIDDMSNHPETVLRTRQILSEARALLHAMDWQIPMPYTPLGLHRIFKAGFLPVPQLDYCRDEFPNAVDWETRLIQGAVRLVDASGNILETKERLKKAQTNLALLM
ncbi:MAG: cobalamin-binding protein [Fibrobacterota bacterium]